MAKNYNIR